MKQSIEKQSNNLELTESDVALVERFKNNFKMDKLLNTVGTIEFTSKELKVLYDPFNDDDLDILPWGVVYAPWVAYMRRMRVAFKGSWGMIPRGDPMIEETLVMWPFYLIIRGKLAAYSIGECDYVPSNKKMSYGDACEGAKSNCLMRNCKAIGVGVETWDRKRLEDWKSKHAETYEGTDSKGYKKTYWKRKDGTKKFLYLRIVSYLLELLKINTETFLKNNGKVSLDLCSVEELAKYKDEFEEKIKRKFGYKIVINKKDEKLKKMMLEINKLFDDHGYNMAKKTTLLQKHNLTDINKASEAELISIHKEITSTEKVVSEKPESIEDEKIKKPADDLPAFDVVKKGKSIIQLLNKMTELQKQSGISIKELDDITNVICKGKEITMDKAEEVIKELEKRLKKNQKNKKDKGGKQK